MAKSTKEPKKKPVTKTKVVTTTEDSAPVASKKKSSTSRNTVKKTDISKKSKTSAAKNIKQLKKHSKYNLFAALWGYLKGSWYELTQVRWPNRRETWGMTLAVIFFSAFFVVLILALDAGYKYLFDFILKG